MRINVDILFVLKDDVAINSINTSMSFHTFRVIIEPDENETFHAYVPSLPGCHTWGDSLNETKRHIKEAMRLYVEDLVASGEPVPKEESFDTFETVAVPV